MSIIILHHKYRQLLFGILYSLWELYGIKYMIEWYVMVVCQIDTKHISVQDLKQARISKITYLRLMPIGNVDWSSYPKCLNVRKTYTLVQRNLQSNDTHLHCALHTALDDSYKCRIGIGKLGLSPNGLLYMCAWSEHLKGNKNNEFYLGSILDEDCSEILSKNEVYNNFIRHPQTRRCKIFNVMLNRDLWDESEQLE